ncbi:MAG: SMI1/KNR4 family protein [Polyangiaceae bacterium]|nr:SMI1/KNR4 family protein [Polyangiaceae bacterium]
MNDLWERLGSWAAKNAGRELGLRKGASERAIVAAEEALSLRFPDDFRASLLLHDGQDGDESSLFEWMPGCSPLAPLRSRRRALEGGTRARRRISPDRLQGRGAGRIHSVLWHAKRIPIAGNRWWDGDNTYLDLFPGPKGKIGQLITFVTECDLVVLGSKLARRARALRGGTREGRLGLFREEWVRGAQNNKPNEYPNRADQFATFARNKR